MATLSIEGDGWHVLSYRVHEAVFAVPELVCEANDHTRQAADPATLIGKKAEVTVTRNDGGLERAFFGVVVSAERRTAEDDVRTLHLTIAPRLWRCGQRADCRTFQEKSTVDIVKEVLQGAGVPDMDWQLVGDYGPRVYANQYRETDLDFVRRLLAEEGIVFFVTMADGKDTVTFTDDPKGIGPIAGESKLDFVQGGGLGAARDSVTAIQQKLAVRSDKVMVRDYDPQKPKVFVEGKGEGTDEGGHSLEVYSYPARTADKAVAERYAKVRIESMQAERDVVTGETHSLAMQPGHRFELDRHPYAPLNQEYLVLSVECSGSEPRVGAATGTRVRSAPGASSPRPSEPEPVYRCRFTAIPTKKSKLRPPPSLKDRAGRPLGAARTVPGLQTAITTGPPGEEIHTEAGGHTKAQFHWDRLGKKDDKSSRWMRVSQMTANGAVLLPRMGWEVTVLCNEGDVDWPVVMGRLCNAVTPPPYALPAGKSRSSVQTATSPGGGSSNEFRTDDTKGKEEMFFNASKDMSVDVKNNTTESVANNQTRVIGSNQKMEITNSLTASVGANQTVQVGGNQKVAVSTYVADEVGGAHSLSVGGDRSMKIGGDHKREVTSDSTLTVNGMSIDLVVGSVSESTLASHTHTVGAALIEMTAASKSVLVGAVRNETVGGAKIIVTKAGRAVEVGGPMSQQVAGAIIAKVKGDQNASSGATYTEIAAGAQVIKATNITFEGETMLSVVMGASTITLMPALIAVAGVSVKVDGDAGESAAMIIEN
jgi:type VI secretion system secreted protein VgrG